METADWVVVSPAIPLKVIAQQPPVEAAFTTAEGLFLSAHHGRRIAITGTKGKSTTCHILGALLQWPVAGNSNEPLLDVLNRCGPDQDVICELSSFQLRYLSRQGAPCLYAGITTLDQDHLDWHISIEEYHQAKLQLLGWAKHIIIGPKVSLPPTMRKEIEAKRITGQADEARHILASSKHQLIGKHNVENMQLALEIALDLGCSAGALQQRLEKLQALEHRLEPVHKLGHISFINDSIATNPLATRAAIEAIDGPPGADPWWQR